MNDKKVVVIGRNDFQDVSLDFDELHVSKMIELAKFYGLEVNSANHIDLGNLFKNNNYILLQISQGFTIIFMPDEVNNYQLDILKEYINEYNLYRIVDNNKNKTINYDEAIEYINNVSVTKSISK